MEEQATSMFELQVDESAQASLRDTTKWTRFISIMLCIFMGLMVFSLIVMLVFNDVFKQAFNSSPQMSQIGAGSGLILTVVGIVVIICLAVFGSITYTLLRFSTQTRKGVDHQNQVWLENGISSLKNYMIITGVLGILGLISGVFQLFILL